MAPTTYHRPDDVDLGALLQAALRSLPRLALVALALAAATYGMLGVVAPRFVSETQEALEPEIARLAEAAAAAEAAVKTFRRETTVSEGANQAERQLALLDTGLSRLRAARSEAEARARLAREMQQIGAAETLADVQRSPLIQSLVQSRARVERQISELSATLVQGHPRMRQLVADLKDLKGQIDAEVAKIVDELATEAKMAALREEAVQADINARIVIAGPDETKLRSLEAEARSKRAELDRLRAQYEANRGPAGDSVFPKPGQTALLVAVAAMMIGLALVVARGLLGSARSAAGPAAPAPRSGRRERHQPVLPVLQQPAPQAPPVAVKEEPPASAEVDLSLPRVAPAPAAPPAVGTGEASAEPEAEAVQEVATHDAMAAQIAALHGGRPSGTRTLFTGSGDVSSLAGEAAAVCRLLAEKGAAVIMVDWSLDGSGIAETLGLPCWPGFAELVDGRARFEDVVRALRDSDVHLIPCGRGPEDSDEPLEGDSLNFLLDALDDVYEHIVVVARTEPARRLFEAIQGRFDCGVTLVADAAQKARVREDGPGSFLGFDVEGIALFALEQSEGQPHTRVFGKLAHAG